MRAFLRFILKETTPAARSARWASLVGVLVAGRVGTDAYLVSPGPEDSGLVYAGQGALRLAFVMSALVLVAYGIPATAYRAYHARGRTRWEHAAVLVAAVGGMVLFLQLPRLTRPAREAMLAWAVADHPMIAAIERYQRENVRPPRSLDELVPRYAPAVVLHTVRTCRNLKYGADPGSGRWELSADCPNGSLTLDQLRYRSHAGAPLEEYEVRLGGWRYRYD